MCCWLVQAIQTKDSSGERCALTALMPACTVDEFTPEESGYLAGVGFQFLKVWWLCGVSALSFLLDLLS